MYEPIEVYQITVRERVTRLGFTCEPDSTDPSWYTFYLTDSQQYSLSESIDCDDGPIADTEGRPLFFGRNVPSDRVFEIAHPIYASQKLAAIQAPVAILPVPDMLSLFDASGCCDTHSWVIFSLNLVYECLRPSNARLPTEIQGTFWTMHNYFTGRHDIDGLFADTELTCGEARDVLERCISLIMEQARFLT